MKMKNKMRVIIYSFIPGCFLFATELFMRLLLGFPLGDFATLRIFFASFFYGEILFLLSLFFKNPQKRYVFTATLLFLASLYNWLQFGFHNYLGMFVSLNTASQAVAVTDYIQSFLRSFPFKSYIIFAPFLIYILSFFKQPLFLKGETTPRLLASLGVLFLSIFLWSGTIFLPFMQNSLQLVSNKELLLNPSNSSIAVNQFGGLTYLLLDIKGLFFPHQTVVEDVTLEEKEDDSLWLEVNNEEKNPTYKKLNSYFLKQEQATKNAYTGYFKGKNVIVVMLESVNYAIDNAKYFPNFTRMLKNSWYWENNYSPRGACPTADNEFSGITSLFSIPTTCTANTYIENTYFPSIFNRFKESGYKVTSFHDFDDTYYSRSIYHPHLGSEHYYNVNELNIAYINDGIHWPNDSLMMGQVVSLAKDDSKPFMSFVTTVSAHMAYAYDSGEGDKYMSLFEDLGYDEELTRYLSKLKITDDSLGVLLDSLQNEGILDDTVIVMYGDHYPYGLSKENVSKVVSYDVNYYNDIEKTPFVIYNSKLEAKVFNQKTSYINILPTLANLFALDYDARFYVGQDLFSENYENRVIFTDSSWMDDKAFYNALNGTITYLTDEKYTTEEIQKINQAIYNKKEMSRLAITSNYFDYLEKALQERKENRNEETNDRGVTSQE